MSDKMLELANPPLMCVVARVEVALIPKMENAISDIQEQLRQKGYPFLFESGAVSYTHLTLPTIA